MGSSGKLEEIAREGGGKEMTNTEGGVDQTLASTGGVVAAMGVRGVKGRSSPAKEVLGITLGK